MIPKLFRREEVSFCSRIKELCVCLYPFHLFDHIAICLWRNYCKSIENKILIFLHHFASLKKHIHVFFQHELRINPGVQATMPIYKLGNRNIKSWDLAKFLR